jgi:hypothetical protein
MNNWSVYKHTSPSGKVYIGITSKKPKERWNSGYGYKKSKGFWNAIMKYGWSNIKHEILYENLEQFEAERIEKELIAFYRSTDSRYGYNIATGGCVNFGVPAWNKGLPKECQPQYGKTKPKEVREKIAESLSKPIVCVETDVIFSSAQLASKMLQIQFSNISRCLHGRGHTAGGYHWRWLNEN